MASKKANGMGSVTKRSDGTYEARFSYVDVASGVQRRASSYGKTQAEATRKMREKKRRVEAGRPVKDVPMTVREFALRWIDTTLAASSRKDSTKSLYASLARTYLAGDGDDSIGAKELARLKASDVDALILVLRRMGKSDSTTRQVYTVLRAVLDAAERDRLIDRNPAAQVSRPKVAQKEAHSLSPAEVAAVLKHAESSGNRYARFFRFVVQTGLRRGEALAVRWTDVVPSDEGNGEVRIHSTLSRVNGQLTFTHPKTKRSTRSVRLSARLMDLLEEQKQAQEIERSHAGEAWEETGLVFTTERGTAVDPRNALRAFTIVARRAGIKERVGLHTLRHSAASAALASNVPITDVSRMLGHSSVSITGDIYGHTSTEAQQHAADLLDEAFS